MSDVSWEEASQVDAQGGAQVPAGSHDLKIDVTDADGRTKSEFVSFTVAK